METSSEDVIVLPKDIDDNCPMTGDETDTEPNSLSFDNERKDFDSLTIGSKQKNVDQHNGNNPVALDVPKSRTYQLVHDEEESFSSDQTYLSDEETSSVAGSFDDIGKDEEDSFSSEPITDNYAQERLLRNGLRNRLDQLGELVIEQEYAVQQAREELRRCEAFLSNLNNDIQNITEQIDKAEHHDQRPIYMRLKSKLSALHEELNIEEEVKQKCSERLEAAEYELAQTYIEHSKVLPLKKQLELEEKNLEKVKAEKAYMRLKKELVGAAGLERKRRNKDKEHLAAVRERERRNRQSLIAAKKNRELATKYLKQTMSQVRQRESEEEEKSRNELNRRMNALLSLKQNIELNKENMKSNANVKLSTKKDFPQETVLNSKTGEQLSQDVAARRKRLRQIESHKEAFERKQREREIEVISSTNILEEKQLKKKLQPQPQLWPESRPRRVPRRRSKTRIAPSSGSESMEYGADVEDTGGKMTFLSKFSTDDEGEFSPYGASVRDENLNETETTETDEDEEINIADQHGEDELNEPEFKGLWQENINSSKIMEQQKTELPLRKLSSSNKKRTKLCGFISKPKIIVFKDLTVGETYRKAVVLTNSSIEKSHCQYVGLSDNLKDFVTVEFTPPGAIAAGMSFEISVVFKPMINEDLFGEIEMTSEAGLFYIPVQCLIKRCQVSVSENDIDFKSQIIGETRTKIILLKNSGALSTGFTIKSIHSIDDHLSKVFSVAGISTVASQNKQESNDIDDDCLAELEDGSMIERVLPPFSTMSLKFTFAPDTPMFCESDFTILFTDESIQPVSIRVRGQAIDLPIRVERKIVDLKICMFDRLYQDAVIVSNSASYALRILVEVPNELQNHVDVLPKTAYIQAESQFSLQLKFLPRTSLYMDAAKYYDKDNELLEFPVTLIVADQTQPVKFDVKAFVTPSDFKFDPNEIDFGICSISEKILRKISLTNVCSLVQQYGFINNPEYIDIQPNDGFGTLLPNETIDIDVYFAPTKPKEYNFTINCKSHIGREFTIKCKGSGSCTPLVMSENLIKFKATAVDSESRTHIFIKNHIQTMLEKSSKERLNAQAPVFFKFQLEDRCPLRVSPLAGVLIPGEKRMLHVIFAPTFKQYRDDTEHSTNEVALPSSKPSVKPTQSTNTKEIQDGNKGKNKVNSKTTKNKTSANQSPTKNLASVEENVENETEDIFLYNYKDKIKSMMSYEDTFEIFKIPCFMKIDQESSQEFNPLYLQVVCPSVKSSLLAVSDKYDNIVDFGDVTAGRRHTKGICLKNLSEETLNLFSTLLDPMGPFELVNTIKCIGERQSITLQFSFTPQTESEFYETMEITSCHASMKIHLKGRSFHPHIEFGPPDKTFHIGETLVGDKITSIIKIKNVSALPVEFQFSLGSLSPYRHVRTQGCDNDFLVSRNNSSGVCVLSISPLCGSLQTGETKDVSISFSPETTYDLYHDQLLVNVNGIEEFERLHLTAMACDCLMFTKGWLQLEPQEEFQLSTYSKNIKHASSKVVFLDFIKSRDDEKFIENIIEVGCVRLSTPVKKPCDFVFENTKEANEEGFTVEPLKGSVDLGGKKNITFKWTPRKDISFRDDIETTMTLIIRGDVTLTYKVILRARTLLDINE